MNIAATKTPNGIYSLNPEINPNQLYDAINAYLCKAEALAAIAATIDFESYESEIINNLMWTVSDFIREARWLCGKTIVSIRD
jgi:hypothetical protein